MSATTTEAPPQPSTRVAKELLANTGFLMSRLGIAVKTRALAEFDKAGYEMYHYAVLALLGEGAREKKAALLPIQQIIKCVAIGPSHQ